MEAILDYACQVKQIVIEAESFYATLFQHGDD